MATGRIPTTANSPLTAKGDLFTFSTGSAKLAVGNSGDTLVADSSATTGLRWEGNYAAGKNNLLNGNMQIAQRGTSFTSITAGLNYGADRYNLEPSNLGTYTVTNVSDAPTVLGQAKSFKVLVTTANASPAVTAYSIFQTAMEGQASQFLAKGTASAQISTLSFWTKSNKTGTYSLIVYDAINSRAFGANYTISAVDTWEKKTITVPADATGTITNDNAVGMRIYWNLAGGANLTSGSLLSSWGAFSFGNNWMPGQTNLAANVNNYWQITGIQWELGSVATAFQTATGTIQGELAACQRYFWQIASGTGSTFSLLAAEGSNTPLTFIQAPVTMRIAPTLVQATGASYYVARSVAGLSTLSSFTTDNTTTNGITIYGSATITAGNAGRFITNNASSSLALNSEL